MNKHTGAVAWRVETPKSAGGHTPCASLPAEAHAALGGGRFLAWALFMAADADQDEQITPEEFDALAVRWFEAADEGKFGAMDG